MGLEPQPGRIGSAVEHRTHADSGLTGEIGQKGLCKFLVLCAIQDHLAGLRSEYARHQVRIAGLSAEIANKLAQFKVVSFEKAAS